MQNCNHVDNIFLCFRYSLTFFNVWYDPFFLDRINYLGENNAPSPHGAVDIYKWNVIPSLTFNFPDAEGSNK